ncbi:MAG: OB-fold nucleic acid binding domain-containing protein [ANME-2 cluster archaeon]|nr:OB-fold nucleic acid binding domain-containing protein [ANME-2 cluster archaeon]
MHKDEKITVILMVMALLVIIIAYFGFIAGDSTPSEYSEGSNVGDRVILHGQVVDKRGTFTGDHLILTIDSESTIVKVFVNRNNGASAVNKSVNVADTVEITGILDKYEDEKEIVVEEAEDVKVL